MLKSRVHMLMMCIHSNDEDYKVVKYGERIDFLPPKQTIPKLSLLAGHFLPLKYFKEDIRDGSIDFKLDSLVQLCQWKIKQMIDMFKVKAGVLGKRRHCPEIGEFGQVQLSKCIKLEELTEITNPSS